MTDPVYLFFWHLALLLTPFLVAAFALQALATVLRSYFHLSEASLFTVPQVGLFLLMCYWFWPTHLELMKGYFRFVLQALGQEGSTWPF